MVKLEAKPLTLTTELPGRTSAFRVAEVRARVNGIVLERLFTEGSDVKQGDKLFRIDAAPYQATLERDKAALARAEAALAHARVEAARYAELLREGVASRQQHDNAAAALKAAEADVAASSAAVKASAIQIGFTTVTAPVSGRIGRAEVTEGAYAQAATATRLATIQQLDPMYVDVTWSSAEALKLRRDLESGKLEGRDGEADVVLLLEDGREYAEKGKLQFADVTVDPSTGSISLRALFPNPKRELMPGLFVRARLAEGTRERAVLVPQRGVTRDPKGRAFVLVVGAGNRVERREIRVDRAVGDAWLVLEGLGAGDQVIVEGLQRARPGAEVRPVPA